MNVIDLGEDSSVVLGIEHSELYMRDNYKNGKFCALVNGVEF